MQDRNSEASALHALPPWPQPWQWRFRCPRAGGAFARMTTKKTCRRHQDLSAVDEGSRPQARRPRDDRIPRARAAGGPAEPKSAAAASRRHASPTATRLGRKIPMSPIAASRRPPPSAPSSKPPSRDRPTEDARPLRPMSSIAAASPRPATRARPAPNADDAARPMSPAQLGNQDAFSIACSRPLPRASRKPSRSPASRRAPA